MNPYRVFHLMVHQHLFHRLIEMKKNIYRREEDEGKKVFELAFVFFFVFI